MQHVYISYPKHDYDLAHRLVDDLQAAGYVVFIDAVSEAGTLAWAAETRRAIRSCGALIMILDGRRVGIRHEGILARRRGKPIVVLARGRSDLPRYLADATLIDFTGNYDTALRELLAVLPPAAALMAAPSLPDRYRAARRPPRPRHESRRRHRLGWAVGLALVAMLCIALGIAVGVIPV